MKKVLLIITILLLSCSTKEQVDIGLLPKDEMHFQKMIIRQLSGEDPIKTVAGKSLYLNSRWDTEEREVSRKYFEALFNQLGVTPYRHYYTMPNSNLGIDFLIEPLKGVNIYTILPSTNGSEEYVILGAHYDTDGKNFPGALDNGSGVSLITSVLRRATEIKHRHKNLMVVYFDQEEENISAGSIAFAKFLKAREYDVHSVHSYDLIGWDGDNNKEIELERPGAAIAHIYKKHANRLGIPIYVTKATSSDFYSFIKAGINAVGISQAISKGDTSGKKDSPADTYHLVNFEYLASSSQLAFEVIKELLHDQSNTK
ncbi:MAG: M28 family peptidase [Bacteroidota bacterium]